MPTRSSCCARAAWWSRAIMRRCWPRTAGTRASGATSNWRRASMPAEFVGTARLPAEPAQQRKLLGDAAALLMRAAAPERANLLHGVAWLTLAAGLEALGPAIAKLLI